MMAMMMTMPIIIGDDDDDNNDDDDDCGCAVCANINTCNCVLAHIISPKREKLRKKLTS